MIYIKKYLKYKKKYLQIKKKINIQGGTNIADSEYIAGIDDILITYDDFDYLFDLYPKIETIYKPFIYILYDSTIVDSNKPNIITLNQFNNTDQSVYNPYIYKKVNYDDKNISQLEELKGTLTNIKIKIENLIPKLYNYCRFAKKIKDTTLSCNLTDLNDYLQRLESYLQTDKTNIDTQKRILDELLLKLDSEKRDIDKSVRIAKAISDLAEKDEQLAEKDEQLEEKDEQLEKKDTELKEKTKLINEIRQHFNDPITHDLFEKATLASDTQTYSYNSIKQLITDNIVSPITRKPFMSININSSTYNVGFMNIIVNNVSDIFRKFESKIPS